MKRSIDSTADEKMKDAINARLNSDSWDFTIAHRVIEARVSKKDHRITIWSFASLATAAVSFIIFMTGITITAIENRNYRSSGSIYTYAYIDNTRNLNNDVIAARLELTINEAYPMR